MKIKILEVRDRGTFIPVVAVEMFPSLQEEPGGPLDNSPNDLADRQRYLLRRVGYPCDDPETAQCVLFRANGDGHAYSDPYSWGNRTMQNAHEYILKHFHELRDGDVVDVEFILGESVAPKVSERAGCGDGL